MLEIVREAIVPVYALCRAGSCFTKLLVDQGYYQPRSSRPNLVILMGAEVINIQFESQNKTLIATQVNYIKDTNETFSVPVGSEVIISAGIRIASECG